MIVKKLLLFATVMVQCFYSICQQAKTTKYDWSDIEMQTYAVKACFQSKHLDSLEKKAMQKELRNKDTNEFFIGNAKLSDKDFGSLSPTEKFIYAHQYPESYSQNCSMYAASRDLTKIYSNIPFMITGEKMSERQKQSLKDNRTITLACLEKCIKFNSYISLGYKQTILTIDAWELIPSILSLEERMHQRSKEVKDDPYLYSLLMVLMKQDGFKEFVNTDIYKKLYSEKVSYRASIDFTEKIRKTIIDVSKNFYTTKTAQQ
jgi:hypothetical protein